MQLDAGMRTLTEERNRSAAVLSSMSEGVVAIGSNQRVIFCNAAFCRAVGIENTNWRGRPVVEMIPNADLLGYIQQAFAGATVASELVVGSVRTRSFAVTATPVLSEGEADGAVMVLHDISELRRLERARRDFVANVSHEFKTPLTAIQGFAETLLGGALEDAQNSRRFLEIIRENAIRLGLLPMTCSNWHGSKRGSCNRNFSPSLSGP
jgi:two-component system phosphate regulon sensor histidine kinase PhoR